jgi:hypothetical protein
MEMASGRRIDRARHIAMQNALVALDRRVRDGNGRKQQLGVGMQRSREEGVLLGALDNATEIHHGDAMADVLHHGEIV